jgi:hypothetical protein
VDCGFGACPAVHYGEEDGYFYVISGGRTIALARSHDFQAWEHAPPLVRRIRYAATLAGMLNVFT